MKKSLSLLLAIALVFGMFSGLAFAAEKTPGQLLNEAGVILGSGSDLKEDETWSRQDMAVLLSRLYGAEEEAKNTAKNHTFADVKGTFYDGYITWAKSEELMKGHNDLRFGFDEKLSAQAFAQVMLRVLGIEATWDEALAKGIEEGILPEGTDNSKPFTRGESYQGIVNALNAEISEGVTLGGELGLAGFVNVASATVVDKDTVKVAFTDGVAKEFDVNPALQPNVKTKVTVEYEGTSYELEVTYVVEKAEVKSVVANNLKQVVVEFTAALDKDSAENKANYTIDSLAFETAALSADGTKVTLTLDDAAETIKFDNQKEYKITIDGVKGANGTAVPKVEKKAFTAVDVTLPTVEKVEALGTKALKITFSEPVKGSTAVTTNNFKIDGKSIAGSVKYNFPNSLIISTTMTTGDHKLSVSEVSDFAGLKVVANDVAFVVAEDKEAPVIVKAEAKDLTKVEIEFNEPVKAVAKASHSGEKTATIAISDNKVTLTFSSANRLNITDTLLTIKDVEDYSGNKATREVTVTPKLDMERPTVTEVKAEVVSNNHKITVTFNEDVTGATNGANYTIKDKDGKAVTGKGLNHEGHPVVAVSYADKKASFSLVGKLDAGTYTVEVAGVQDTAYVANTMMPYSSTITIGDTGTPTFSKVWYEQTTITGTPTKYDTVLYVRFSEAVAIEGDGNALNLTKYNYTTSGSAAGSTWVPFPTGTTVELIGNDTVKLTLPRKETSGYGITGLRATLVSDTAGNYIGSDYVAYSAVSNSIGTIAINSAEATAKNTLKVEFQGVLSNIDANDFGLTVTSVTYDLILSTYSVKDGKTTVEFNTTDGFELTADRNGGATFEVVRLAADVASQDSFGSKVAVSSVSVADKIRPAAVDISNKSFIYDNAAKTITVAFDEAIAVTGTPVSVVEVKKNGDALTVASVAVSGMNLVITLDPATATPAATDIIQVSIKSANNDVKFIKDVDGEAVEQITRSNVYSAVQP